MLGRYTRQVWLFWVDSTKAAPSWKEIKERDPDLAKAWNMAALFAFNVGLLVAGIVLFLFRVFS